jgi:tetratricopeptide (TPR) repeat protein
LEPNNAWAWINRADAYNRLGQYDKAIADCSKDIELEPKNWVGWNSRGGAYLGLQQHDKAFADINKGIELDPKSWIGWNGRGHAYMTLSQYDKAIADYSKVIELEPKNSVGWTNRGNAYTGMGQYDKAVADFSKVIELDQKNASAWYLRALLCLKLDDHKAYRQVCGAMLDSFRGAPPETVRLIGWACALGPDNGVDSDRLVELAEKLASQNPKSRSDQTIFGAALCRAGRFEEAERRLNQAAALPADPFQPVEYAWFFLALAHQRLGHAKEAHAWLEKTQKQIEQKSSADVPWNRRLTLQLLSREAEALLGIKEKKGSGDSSQQTQKKQ